MAEAKILRVHVPRRLLFGSPQGHLIGHAGARRAGDGDRSAAALLPDVDAVALVDAPDVVVVGAGALLGLGDEGVELGIGGVGQGLLIPRVDVGLKRVAALPVRRDVRFERVDADVRRATRVVMELFRDPARLVAPRKDRAQECARARVYDRESEPHLLRARHLYPYNFAYSFRALSCAALRIAAGTLVVCGARPIAALRCPLFTRPALSLYGRWRHESG